MLRLGSTNSDECHELQAYSDSIDFSAFQTESILQMCLRHPVLWCRPLTLLFFLFQYGEEEVSSDRLDADFPDFDLSQLDASDFDSVNCLGELHWCNEHSDHSPASIQYSAGDTELFEVGTSISAVESVNCKTG